MDTNPKTDEQIEADIVAAGLTAPRLTNAVIQAAIAGEAYVLIEGSTTMICALHMANGFVITGESACASPENFDEKVGADVAYKNAVSKVWQLEGYLLKQRLFERVDALAMAAHEVNRAYCAALGDKSQLSWSEAPEWQRSSARDGVRFVLANPDAPVSATHDAWSEAKIADGWSWGVAKDPEAKTHPCLVAFDQLPPAQQAKDYIFRAVVLNARPL